jgi:putative ABC transport system permease protein
LDAAAYEQITAGTPAEQHFTTDMLATLPAGADAVPAIVSANSSLRTGTRGALQAGAKSVTVQVVATSTRFGTVAPDEQFVLVSHDQLAALAPDVLATNPPDTLFIAAPASASAALTAAAAANPGLAVQSADEVAQTLGQTPVSRAVGFGLAASALAAAFYAALAVAAAFVLASADQRVETAYLRVMGLSRAQRLRLVFVEHVPAALVAAIVGGALGVFVFVFIRPALGLPTILPESADITFSINPLEVAALLGAALLVVLPAWALAAFAQREPNPAAAVRETGA